MKKKGALATARHAMSLAHNIIHMELQRRVNKILLGNNSCIGFVMAMGSFRFDYRGDRGLRGSEPDPGYTYPVYNLIEEFDDVLKITGNPIKMELINGKVVTTRDW